MIKRARDLDERILKKELGAIKAARIVRLALDRGYGFLRGEGDQADTFFHVHVVRYTEAEMKRRREDRGGPDRPPLQSEDAFHQLKVGDYVMFLPSGMSKDGKGARARWVGVGDPGGLV